MTGLSLVMPMAGRGSRFARDGIAEPKPLIELAGRPFFWWAAESVRRAVPVAEMVFVVLDEHCRAFAIDRRIREFYPEAEILALPAVTAGAAETARLGVAALRGTGPIAVNDCDHAFLCDDLGGLAGQLVSDVAAALLCFRSDSPAYSYLRLVDGNVVGTVEKQVVSPFAIAGCYLFANAATFAAAYETYRLTCPYDELFVSGLADVIAAQGGRLAMRQLPQHRSFGTPEELALIDERDFAATFGRQG
jgi:dTDP-glucose pyrophosphorylase